MAQARSLSELESLIKNHIINGMKEDVSEVIKDEEVDSIISEVYSKYDPVEYNRRFDNSGLSDKDNMETKLYHKNNEVIIEVVNMTTGNPNQGDEEDFIAPIVEYGHGKYGVYHYSQTGNEPYARPRRFMKTTISLLNQNKKHVQALKDYLNRQGVKTK